MSLDVYDPSYLCYVKARLKGLLLSSIKSVLLGELFYLNVISVSADDNFAWNCIEFLLTSSMSSFIGVILSLEIFFNDIYR